MPSYLPSVSLLASVTALLLLAACEKGREPAPTEAIDLLSQDAVTRWQAAELTGAGAVKMQPGLIRLEAGQPVTAARFTGWEALALPLCDYEVKLEARRVEGNDFFATLTFPIGSLSTSASLVLGGWGGGLVGISSLDGQDASENSTRSEHVLVNDLWYQMRMVVKRDELMAWLDDRLVINTSLKGRRIGLRLGDIEACAPFGLASYGTTGEVRRLSIRRL
jgi:hypothetical protein